jgi:hypothetical protein
MPINYLLIEALQKFHHYFGPSFRVECPTGSGRMKTLWEVSLEISQRLIRTFEKDSRGRRRFYHGMERLENDPEWGQELQFYEFFNAETGAGVGASHHTGWTGLIAKLIQPLPLTLEQPDCMVCLRNTEFPARAEGFETHGDSVRLQLPPKKPAASVRTVVLDTGQKAVGRVGVVQMQSTMWRNRIH